MDELFPFLLFPLLEVTEDLLLEAFSCVLKRKFINSELLRPLIFFSIKAYENNMAIVSTIMMIKFSMSFFINKILSFAIGGNPLPLG
uniref:hypothetical protein n=1 Tax=Anaerobutyricum hallii TaxID=39488 RepID=UPI003FF02FE6